MKSLADYQGELMASSVTIEASKKDQKTGFVLYKQNTGLNATKVSLSPQ